MLLLVTGASGMGKTTVRKLLEPQLQPEVDCRELAQFSPNPSAHSLRWRQETTALAVDHAVRLQREGRHLLLCGDPIAAVEVAAAPTATQLDALALCLLDATAAAQAARLSARGDDPSLLRHHQAFSSWMRQQAVDPLYMLEVVSTNGWDQMQWGRIRGLVHQWQVHAIDTTGDGPETVALHVLRWIRAALAGESPLVRPAQGLTETD